MDDPELTDPNDFELDIELCKLVSRIPFFGENLAKNLCEGIDYSGEFHDTFSKIFNLSEQEIKGLLITNFKYLFTFNKD